MANHRILSNIATNNVPPLFSQRPLPGQSLSDHLNTLSNVEDRFNLIIAVLEGTSKNFEKSQQQKAATKAVEGILDRRLGVESDAEFDAALEKMADAENGAEFDAQFDFAERAAARKTLDARKTHDAVMTYKAMETDKVMATLEDVADVHLDVDMDAEMVYDLDLVEAAESMMLMGDRFGVDGSEHFSAFAREFEYCHEVRMTLAKEYRGGNECMSDEDMGNDNINYQQMELVAEGAVEGRDGYLGREMEYEMEDIRGL